MTEPEYSPAAERDLHAILDHIAAHRPQAAEKVIERVRAGCQKLVKSPGRGTSRDDLQPGLRCISLPPYVIYFRPIRDTIQVVRILHGARNEQDEIPAQADEE